ncbi:Methyltransferase small domain-containing protein [Microbacterium sp. 8M]|uniref:N5-glutamine methyltransferase family protein n=1 Tax=Microbacterium sp. 8M TaxID=2653153 RepID=UPI0012F1A5E2|nr:class I SAM-dependent methyltransferase [Microbacterium sp. 8M]VXB88334.1 Methyltransferase small domain-containing protein [Microbacterium sp. 8M]
MVRHLTPRPDPLLCAALAADLDAADLRSEPLRAAWGAEADDALARGVRSPLLRAIAGRTDALATLGRLFVLGMPQPEAEVAAALARTGVDGIEALGLAYRDGGLVVPAALIRPQSFVDADGVGEWWIASDLDELALHHLDADGVLPPDHVLGVGGASRTLASLVMPIEVERALDLGTGCGIQALLVSRHAGSVIATDISARALAYAELNAMLAGVQNIEFRCGSLFEPVAGESFGLIVSNPPFVITPRGADVPEYEYRDGGLIGDALVEAFVRTAPAHLVPGGAAQLLGNWESIGAELGMRRMESWIDPALDAWVVQRETLSPLAYAELWIRDGGTTPRDAGFEPLLDAWLDDFAVRGVTEIGFGYVLIRRPDVAEPEGAPPAPLRRFETLTQPVTSVGRAFRDGLAGHDALADGLPDVLLVAPDVTEARHHLPGQDAPSVIELRQGGGFGRTVSVDPALAGFVGACDGELTVTQIAAALADLFEVPLADLWADLEPRLRGLVTDGFLIPAGGGTE